MLRITFDKVALSVKGLYVILGRTYVMTINLTLKSISVKQL